MAKGVSVTLYDASGAVYASGTNIDVLWFDSEDVPNLEQIVGRSAVATTTAGGVLSLDLDGVTGLAVGGWGFLVCYKLDGTDYRDSPCFMSRMQVQSMTGTTSLRPISDWVRNPDWPAQVAPVNGVQKITSLLRVTETDLNVVAFAAAGAYTVDWGDGSSENVASTVKAEHNYSYASVPGTIVGASGAVAVTFTDTGDTVNRTAHGYSNGQPVAFASITSTTGISANTTYYVVGRTANTFQVAATRGGAALTLTTNGSGTVFIPQYKVAVITVTPQAGQNLTSFSLIHSHSAVSSLVWPVTPWLSHSINGEFLASLYLVDNVKLVGESLEEVYLGENALLSTNSLFAGATKLASIPVLNTSGVTDFSWMFGECRALRSVPPFDTSSATSVDSLFDTCESLLSIPALDTSSATNFSTMFRYCASVRSFPLLNTTLGQNFSLMFYGCSYAHLFPLIDTSSGTNFSNMFSGCRIATEFPLLDTSQGTNFSYMYEGCYRAKHFPLLDTSQGTNFSYMYSLCSSMLESPALNVSSGANFTAMFGDCVYLVYVPPLDTSAGTDFTGMFAYCYALREAPVLDTHLGTDFVNMFGDTHSLVTVPLYDLSSAVNLAYMFVRCIALQNVPLLNVSNVTVADTGMGLDAIFEGARNLKSARLEGATTPLTYFDCSLSAAALNDIFTGLGTVSVATSITITQCAGAATCNTSIATAKGWTVVN